MQNVASFPSTQHSEAEVIDPEPLQSGAVLFCDFDGPIADVSDRYYNTYLLALTATQEAYAKCGISLPVRRLTKAQFWRMKQNRVPDTTIADWSGLSEEETRDFLSRVQSLVNQPTLLHQDQLQPGTKAALAALNDWGIKVAIVTLRQSSQVWDFLSQHDLTTDIHQIYGVEDTAAAYPNRVEHKVVQLQDAIADQHRLGRNTTASWMIGDTEADVCAGQAAGLPTVALTCGIRSANYLRGFHPTQIHQDLYATTKFLIGHPPTVSSTPSSAFWVGM